MGISGLICDQLFLIFVSTLDIWCTNMLHPAPLVIYKQIYWEHDTQVDGLLCWIELDMNFLRNTRWHGNGQFISCWIWSAFDFSYYGYALSFMLRLLQLASFALVYLLVITFDSQFIWPEWSRMMKRVCYDQTDFAEWLLIQAWSLICFLLNSNGTLCSSWGNFLYVLTTL